MTEKQAKRHPLVFWCQKVMPIVYDDSISYYELLCKVVAYLNKLLEDMRKLIESQEELYKAFGEFQKYLLQLYDQYKEELAEQNQKNFETWAANMENKFVELVTQFTNKFDELDAQLKAQNESNFQGWRAMMEQNFENYKQVTNEWIQSELDKFQQALTVYLEQSKQYTDNSITNNTNDIHEYVENYVENYVGDQLTTVQQQITQANENITSLQTSVNKNTQGLADLLKQLEDEIANRESAVAEVDAKIQSIYENVANRIVFFMTRIPIASSLTINFSTMTGAYSGTIDYTANPPDMDVWTIWPADGNFTLPPLGEGMSVYDLCFNIKTRKFEIWQGDGVTLIPSDTYRPIVGISYNDKRVRIVYASGFGTDWLKVIN